MGFACDKCGGKTTVLDVRDVAHGVRRRHQCKVCGRRCTTIEVLLDDSISVTPVGKLKISSKPRGPRPKKIRVRAKPTESQTPNARRRIEDLLEARAIKTDEWS